VVEVRLVAHHDLGDPGGVAQVQEGHPSVVAAPADPAGQRDGLSDVLGAQGAEVVGAQH
jgi:hypothetical protein